MCSSPGFTRGVRSSKWRGWLAKESGKAKGTLHLALFCRIRADVDHCPRHEKGALSSARACWRMRTYG